MRIRLFLVIPIMPFVASRIYENATVPMHRFAWLLIGRDVGRVPVLPGRTSLPVIKSTLRL